MHIWFVEGFFCQGLLKGKPTGRPKPFGGISCFDISRLLWTSSRMLPLLSHPEEAVSEKFQN